MANYFVDSTTGDNGDNGTTMDLAWATFEHACESGGLSAGDIVWIRRLHSEIPGTDIEVPSYDGTALAPIEFVGWPRAAATGTADVYNGLAGFVDLSITGDREKHCSRMIKNDADGKEYLITAIGYYIEYDGHSSDFVVGETIDNNGTFSAIVHSVVETAADSTGIVIFKPGYTVGDLAEDDALDSGGTARADVTANFGICFIIDRPYAGSDAADGNFTVAADDHYAADMGTEYGFDDSGWTIKEAAWDADADDIPVIDFDDGNFQLIFSGDKFFSLYNIEFKDSSDGNGIIYILYSCILTRFINCLFKQSIQNDIIFHVGGLTGIAYLEKCIIEGSNSANSSQKGVLASTAMLKNCAIFGCGDNGIACDGGVITLQNVNIGIEQNNHDDDIQLEDQCSIVGVDVQMGGSNGYIQWTTPVPLSKVAFENYNKQLGIHRTWFPGGDTGTLGSIRNVDVDNTDNRPNSASPAGNTSDIIEIRPQGASGYEFEGDMTHKIFEHIFDATTDSKTYTYYIQNYACGTLNDTTATDDIWIKAEYIDAHDASDEYHRVEKFSTEIDIAERADADDWDSLSVAVQPAVASLVKITMYLRKYDADGLIFVDPEPVIS